MDELPQLRPPRMPQRPQMPTVERPNPTGEYWYVVANVNGRIFVDGPHSTEYEASEMGLKLNCPYETVPLSTRNKQEAYSRIRHMVLNGTGDLALALKRMKHII